MSVRGFTAVLRLELLRGRRILLWTSGLILASMFLVPVVKDSAALVIGMLSIPIAMVAVMSPLGSLTSDKQHGHLEFDRTLPLSLRTIAAGRLLGAGLRTLPVFLSGVAIGLGFLGTTPTPLDVGLTLMITVVVQVMVWWGVWLFLAVSARFSLRRLWWLPMTLWLAPTLLPDAMMDALGSWAEGAVTQMGTRLDGPAPIAIALVAGVILPTLLIFGGSVALFANGLARYRFDPAGFGVRLGAAPKRELLALGRGVVLAVARLRLRLALEQFRRELIIIGILLAIIVVDVPKLAEFAKMYLPILAALIPSAIGLQLMTLRASGALEGLQHLPHPRWTTALGHLVAVMVMAVPGSVLLVISRAVDGGGFAAGAAFGIWCWYVALGWSICAMMVWATIQRVAMLALGLAATFAVVLFLAVAGPFSLRPALLLVASRTLRDTAGLVLPVVVMLGAIGLGTVLFAQGLATYRRSRAAGTA